MNNLETMVVTDDFLPPGAGIDPEIREFGPEDSYDPLPIFPSSDGGIAPDWTDEVLFFDAPDDDEECDDEDMFTLLEALGVDLGSLGEPVEITRTRFVDEFGFLDESEEDEAAA